MNMANATADVMYPKIVGELRGRLFSASELADLTGVSERQVQRWASGSRRPDGENRTRLLEVHYVVERLRDVFTEEGIEIWLHGRNRSLRGRRPISVLKAGQIDEVLELIEQLHTGAM